MAYRVSRLSLTNWRNFRSVSMDLGARAFIVGANASGKSNLLDSLRFVRDIASDGVQKAVESRDGLSMIRCLWARQTPSVRVHVRIEDQEKGGPTFEYEVAIRQNSQKEVYVESELVTKDGTMILSRPTEDDRADPKLRSQTHLEQISKNINFRFISEFFSNIGYLHLVPQIIKDPRYRTSAGETDPFGSNFLNLLAHTRRSTRAARLKRISSAIRTVVPPLDGITYEPDPEGKPHLVANFQNWRGTPAKHFERHLSDGTIRLIGLLWALLSSRGPLLLEEPELSLHSGVVRRLPGLMARMQREAGSQLIVSTHSSEMLLDKGISADEVFLLLPQAKKPTTVTQASQIDSVLNLMRSGLTAAEVVMPYTQPKQLDLFARALAS